MKKIIYIIIALGIIGAVLSGILSLQHYYPGIPAINIFCTDSFDSPCGMLAQTEYAKIFGVPLAMLGLLFYLFIIFTCLIADYAAEDYYQHAVILLLPVSIAAVIGDLILAGILMYVKIFCPLCVSTYGINVAIMLALFIALRKIKTAEQTTIITIAKSLFLSTDRSADRRAASSLFLLFSVLLCFAILSTDYTMRLKTAKPQLSKAEINEFLDTLYAEKPVMLNLPASGLTIGKKNAPVTITVFSDFLCTACYDLFESEKYLIAKYRGKVRIVYYHYPLDASCNKKMTETIYENSCIAARAMTAAARLNLFEKYVIAHFGRYKEISKGYDRASAESVARDLVDVKKFTDALDSPETDAILERDMSHAEKLEINATPTLFINGRKIVGNVPQEVLDTIIRNELKDHPRGVIRKK